MYSFRSIIFKSAHPTRSKKDGSSHRGARFIKPAAPENEKIKVAFVTHFCPHYRVNTFEILAHVADVEFYFYSEGKEWYGQGMTGTWKGNFNHEYLPGFRLTRRTRVSPALISRLWRKNYDVFVKCINGRFALPVTYLIARLKGKPFVLWTGIWMTLQTPFHRIGFPVTRWIYRHADAVVTYGEHVKSYLVEQGVERSKVFVAAHAIENPKYNRAVSAAAQQKLRARLAIENKKVILYLGRLEKEKGLEFLIQAFASMRRKDSFLVIAGEGSLSQVLKILVRQAGVEQSTRFPGYVEPKDTLEFYSIAEVYVLPSITMPTGKEPWGLVVNEAMNQGVPVVATDAVGAAAGGLVQSNVNGFVVPERDPAALAVALQRILADPELRQRMSLNARQIVAQWTNDRMVQGFQKAIQYALRTRSFRQPDVAGVHP